MRRRGEPSTTLSVRMPASELERLDQLVAALDEAHQWSVVGRELQRVRGRHTGYGSPANRGEAIRWAVRFALEHFPVDDVVES